MVRLAVLFFLVSACALTPKIERSRYGMVTVRHVGGISPDKADGVALFAVINGLCMPPQIPGLVIESIAKDHLFSNVADNTVIVGLYERGWIKVSSDRPCSVMLHELAHHCHGDAGHTNAALWDAVAALADVLYQDVCP